MKESYRRLLPVEAFCCAAGVAPSHFLACIAAVAVRQGAQGSAILSAMWLPHVVAKTVERALKDEGVRDRALMHRAFGFA